MKKADEIGAENIAQSEMLAIPKPATAVVDSFFEEPTISVIADILDPVTKQEYPPDPSIDYKRRFGIDELRLRPHPYEFELYYDR